MRTSENSHLLGTSVNRASCFRRCFIAAPSPFASPLPLIRSHDALSGGSAHEIVARRLRADARGGVLGGGSAALADYWVAHQPQPPAGTGVTYIYACGALVTDPGTLPDVES
jgi:hypothetical protein